MRQWETRQDANAGLAPPKFTLKVVRPASVRPPARVPHRKLHGGPRGVEASVFCLLATNPNAAFKAGKDL
jgi:hypothetical protein